jgi:hypothetical protein
MITMSLVGASSGGGPGATPAGGRLLGTIPRRPVGVLE